MIGIINCQNNVKNVHLTKYWLNFVISRNCRHQYLIETLLNAKNINYINKNRRMTTKLAVNQMALITTMVLGGAVVPRAFYSDETKSSLRPEIKM